MFGITKLQDVNDVLVRVYRARVVKGLVPKASVVRGPIGLFVVREDGAFGSKLAEEVVKSFKYWDDRSKYFFDGVFLGWGYDGGPAEFMYDDFIRCVEDLEAVLLWKDQGGAYLLLTDFVYDLRSGTGSLDFEQTIPLDITTLLTKEKYPQLSALIAELIAPARQVRESRAAVSVWEVSDYVALLRTRKFFWKALVKKVGVLLGWADDIAPFAVRDLRRTK